MRSRLPKVLHPVAGRPMVQLVCDALMEAGFGDIVVVTNHEDDRVAAAVRDRARVAVQPEPLGTGHAALAARSAVGEAEHLLILNADLPLLTVRTLSEMRTRHLDMGSTLTFLTAYLEDPTGYGRVLRRNGRVRGIVEETETDAVTRGEPEVNAGLYAAEARWLWPTLMALAPGPRGERYLTDIIGVAVAQDERVQTYQVIEAAEVQQVNTRVELARAEQLMRDRIRRRLMIEGVTLTDPATIYVDAGVTVAPDTTLLPGVHLLGETHVGSGCQIGPNAIIRDSVIGDDCQIAGATVHGAVLEREVTIGAYCTVRPQTMIEAGASLGTHAEVKGSRIGPRARVNHFSYVGDADVGADVNIGAGTVTTNYDGQQKHRTTIGDGAFIGSDSMLIAPIVIGAGARTGAGAVVTHDVPPGALVLGVPARQRASQDPDRGEEAGAE